MGTVHEKPQGPARAGPHLESVPENTYPEHLLKLLSNTAPPFQRPIP